MSRPYRVQVSAGIEDLHDSCWYGARTFGVKAAVLESTAEDPSGPTKLSPGELSEVSAFVAGLQVPLQNSLKHHLSYHNDDKSCTAFLPCLIVCMPCLCWTMWWGMARHFCQPCHNNYKNGVNGADVSLLLTMYNPTNGAMWLVNEGTHLLPNWKEPVADGWLDSMPKDIAVSRSTTGWPFPPVNLNSPGGKFTVYGNGLAPGDGCANPAIARPRGEKPSMSGAGKVFKQARFIVQTSDWGVHAMVGSGMALPVYASSKSVSKSPGQLAMPSYTSAADSKASAADKASASSPVTVKNPVPGAAKAGDGAPACTKCVAAKRACSGEFPCTRCTKLNQEEACTPVVAVGVV